MKFKATKKQMKDGYDKIVSVGYCDLQALLRFENEIAYSVGVNGWACDYYDVKGVLISTGYAPLAEKNTLRSYELIRSYECIAMDIISDYTMDYEDKKAKIKVLLNEFIAVITL